MKLTKVLMMLSLVISLVASCNKENKKIDGGQDSETMINHLLIEEVFYSGSYSSMIYGKKEYKVKYDEDCYLKIVNPYNETLYLDGLYLAQTMFAANSNYQMTAEDFRDTHVGIYCMVKFPGKGKDYPVKPGQSVTITGFAYDHRLDNEWEYTIGNTPSSIDLSKADFEWLTSGQINSKYGIEDNNDVPNMIPAYWGWDSNGNVWPKEPSDVPGERWYRFEIYNVETGLALVKLEKPIEELGKPEYKWEYRMEIINEHTHDLGAEGTCLKLPPEWIVDAVTICPMEAYKERPVPESVDKGWISVVTADSNEWTRRGKSVKRKFDGNTYVDNNNSTLDFEVIEASYFAEQKPQEKQDKKQTQN